MTPKVSIIIPVYKVEKYLDKSIQSCLKQTLKDIEVVLVNDGSPDGCKEIIEHYANIDDRVKFIHKINQGVTLARKDGLSMAVGDYIFYLDGDDYLTDNAIELLYNRAIKENADWVVGDFYLDFGNIILEKKFKDLGVVNNIDFLKYCFENRDFFFMGRLIRTELIKRVDLDIPPNITYGEDNLAVVQIGYNIETAANVNEPVLYYVQRPDSVTNRMSNNDLLQRTLAIKQQLSFVIEKGVYKKIKEAVDYFIINELYFQIVTGYVEEDLAKEFLTKKTINSIKKCYSMSKKQYYTLLFASYNRQFTVNIIKVIKTIKR